MPCVSLFLGSTLKITDIGTKILPEESGKEGRPVNISITCTGGGTANAVLQYGGEKETIKLSNGVTTVKRYFYDGMYNICAELIR